MDQAFATKIESYLQRVKQVYPDFSANSARYGGGGQYNDVIVLDEHWVFRFPRHAKGGMNLEHEVELLRSLRGRLPLAIPDPEFVHLDPANAAQSFMGYPFIRGIALTREIAASMSDDALKTVTAQIVEFLYAMHHVTLPLDVVKPEKPYVDLTYWGNMFASIQRVLFPHMRSDARDHVRNHFESFLSDPRNQKLVPTLIHCDPGAGNFLLNKDRDTVIAVIDFGSAGTGDPATDYAAASTIDPRAFDMMVDRNPEIYEYVDRIRFYKGTYLLQEALYGAETGDEEAFRSGMMEFV